MYTTLLDYVYILLKKKYLKPGDRITVYATDMDDKHNIFSVSVPVSCKGKITKTDEITKSNLCTHLHAASNGKAYDIFSQIVLWPQVIYRDENGRLQSESRIKILKTIDSKTHKKDYDISPTKREIFGQNTLGYKESYKFEVLPLPKEYTDSRLFKREILGPYIYNCIMIYGNSVIAASSYQRYTDELGTHSDLEKEISNLVGFEVKIRQARNENENITFYIVEKREKTCVKS